MYTKFGSVLIIPKKIDNRCARFQKLIQAMCFARAQKRNPDDWLHGVHVPHQSSFNYVHGNYRSSCYRSGKFIRKISKKSIASRASPGME